MFSGARVRRFRENNRQTGAVDVGHQAESHGAGFELRSWGGL